MNLITGTSHPQFASILAQRLNLPLIQPFIKKFSDGNTFVRLPRDLSLAPNVFLQTIAGAKANDYFMELLFLLNAAHYARNPHNLVLLPFFSYGKSDKLDGPGTSLRSQVCAQCLEATNAHSLLTLDLHSSKVLDFFTIPVTNLTPHALFLEFLRTQALINPIIVSPDQGYQLSAQKYAQMLNCPFALGQKTRLDDQENIDKITLQGDFTNKTAIIVDDYTTSGNTILYLAHLLQKRKVKKIIACVTHCLLNSTALKQLCQSPLDLIITTNSVPPAADYHPSSKLIILDCTKLFATALIAALPQAPTD